jgi:ABC-type branched-subunit amino acid transport system permease subunit
MKAIKENKYSIFLIIGVLLLVSILPLLVNLPFVLHVLISTLMYIGFALSYDIVTGQIGAVSLAHASFFGLGAYVTALIGKAIGAPFWLNIIIATILSIGLAIVMSLPAFRLSDLSFSFATLGLALTVQLVVKNWVKITRGPMCIHNVSNSSLWFNGILEISRTNLIAYFYLFLMVDIVIIILYRLISTGRLGRTLTAVRNDEVLASSVGINIQRYKRLTFFISAGIAGAIGSLWAPYISVVCPDYLSMDYTLNLLAIVFIGGSGSLLGVVGGSILLTVLPELLRVTPAFRLIIYGLFLLIFVTSIPNGVKGIISNVNKRLKIN